ncbi:hypothetical protein [Ekhidna sp.]|uniref:hypothetical protein n=1 Tax=Ekhidna sp. TaxID=2608089 RepID=UPI003B58E538
MEVDEIRKKIEEEISKTTQPINDYREQSKPITLINSLGRILLMPESNKCVYCAR